MHTENRVWIAAQPEKVFRLAVEVERWPLILPHYRWVNLTTKEDGQCVAEMAARRVIFTVKWVSTQQNDPERHRIIYHHVQGITQGMDVEWRITPRDGGTQATIIHDLTPQHWLIRNPLGIWIASEFFVKGIANRTLSHIKLEAEREARAESDTILYATESNSSENA